MTEPKTILIVDDSPGVHLIIRNYLGPEYHILKATDGETALHLCKSQRINLVILDLMLPGSIMGSDILQAMRKRTKTASIPVIMMSALPAYQDGLESSGQDVVFLPKPFDKERLLELVGQKIA